MRKTSQKKDFMQISRPADTVLNIIFILWSALCIVPFLLVVGISLSSEHSINTYGYQIIPHEFSTEAYSFATRQSVSLLRAYGVTIFATIVGTVLAVLITTLFAYPLSRRDFRARNVFSFITFFTMIFQGGLIATYMVYVEVLNLKNNLFVYIMPFLMSAWNVILMRTFIVSSVPESLIDAAKIDGASEWTIFFKMVVPLSKPGIATISLFTAISIWNDWFTPTMYITDTKKFNLQYLLYSVLANIEYLKNNVLRTGGNTNILLSQLPTQSIRMAMCIISIGPIILAYPFFQKYFVKGLTMGAVKG